MTIATVWIHGTNFTASKRILFVAKPQVRDRIDFCPKSKLGGVLYEVQVSKVIHAIEERKRFFFFKTQTPVLHIEVLVRHSVEWSKEYWWLRDYRYRLNDPLGCWFLNEGWEISKNEAVRALEAAS